ncbi:MAG: sigma-70 family RNA polymerase sigma factor [Thermoguttaceae bacterium]|nr:sigma-70 family RNA polymerase sigma factor [Thermoguttaceae bacterium]
MDQKNRLEQEFEYIFNDFWTELVNFANQFVGNVNAEDIVQQAMNKIWLQIQQEEIVNPRAWLYKVVYNDCNNFLRSKKKQKVEGRNSVVFKDISESEDTHWKHPIETLIQSEQLEKINSRIHCFSKMERNIYYLTYQSESSFSIEEIALLLGTNKQTISAAKNRLMRKLKELFQDENENL